jgi:hypothetical protein
MKNGESVFYIIAADSLMSTNILHVGRVSYICSFIIISLDLYVIVVIDRYWCGIGLCAYETEQANNDDYLDERNVH